MFRRVLHKGWKAQTSVSAARLASHAHKNRLEEVGSAAIAAHLFLGLSACCSGEHPTAASIRLAASACSFQDSCVFSLARHVFTAAPVKEDSRSAAQRYLGLSACCSGEHPTPLFPSSAARHCFMRDGVHINELPENSALLPVLSGFSHFKVIGDLALSTAESQIPTSGGIRD